MRRFYVWLIVGVVVIASIVAVASAYLLTRPCTPGGEPALVGVHYCPLPPPPSPTTLIANGTVFTVGAGQFDYFQFLPSDATFAEVSGAFTTTHGGAVLIMTPAEFTNFTRSSGAAFPCPSSNYTCFTTGNVSSGTVNITVLPVYRSSTNAVTIEPWFLVMENPNLHDGSNVTWKTDLVLTYVDVVTGVPIGSTLGAPLCSCSLPTLDRS